ncbi:MAG: hypothetical protein C4576_17810 [Desulfobacteraceae bacterium]|nr:MAG: hypothetical protein C4576_17810 [Desulfobacteraceae bacterium]
MPEFDIERYLELLRSLRRAGYRLLPARFLAKTCASGQEKCAFLRHDIDAFLNHIDDFARREADEGVVATYYILLSQHYNPNSAQNRRVIRRIVELGHEIGLHYDMTQYPVEREAAINHLQLEIRFLEDIAGTVVRDIAMHQPHLGHCDYFLDVEGLVNPANPSLHEGLIYVSDSCRAWRDETLLRCLRSGGPLRLLLTIHPEVWLDGSTLDRYEYLERVMLPIATAEVKHFFMEHVPSIWTQHPAVAAHDLREGSIQPRDVKFSKEE